MEIVAPPSFTAFQGHRRIASGSLFEVACVVKAAESTQAGALLVIDDASGAVVDVDTRGDFAAIAERLATPLAPRRRGRPKLGVTAREVTLLPRHWDWLASQAGGASVALRRLVEQARRSPAAEQRAARDATYRFMAAIAGDLPGYEEALRALFAADRTAFAARIAAWPGDIRDHALRLSEGGTQ